MENTALILIAIALILLVIVIGLLSVLIYKLLKDNPQPPIEAPRPQSKDEPDYHPIVLERLKEAKSFKPKRSELFCPNHSDEPGEVTCSICDRMFCKACIKPFKTMHFCKEHLPLIMKHEWDEILTIKTSTTDPEQGVRLYDIKKSIFEKEQIPTYIETHYKINVDQDFIETYLVLFGIKENIDELKKKFKNLL
jgi:hypothetical protein